MIIQPIHPQIDMNVWQTKLDWFSNEYCSNNTNRDRFVKDDTLSCLLDSVHWEDKGISKVYRMSIRNEALVKVFLYWL